jgi:hypothetical protein
MSCIFARSGRALANSTGGASLPASIWRVSARFAVVVAASSLLAAMAPAQSPRSAVRHAHRPLVSRDLPAAAPIPNYAATAIALRHWRQPEVTIYVETPARDRRTPAQIATVVQKGADLWNGRLGIKLLLRLTDDSDADIDIRFVTPGALRRGQIGQTDIQFAVPQQDIAHAEIQINEGLSDDQLTQVVAHEAGHALGIQGHSDDKRDLMYAYAHVPAVISDRDANTMTAAYLGIDTSKKARGFKRGQKFASVVSN